jgi:hypothetical protein
MRRRKGFAPGAVVVFAGAVEAFTKALTAPSQETQSPGLRDAVGMLAAGQFAAAAESAERAVNSADDLVLAHCIRFLSMIQTRDLLGALAEEHVLETLSEDAARAAADCYSISPEILLKLEAALTPSLMQLAIAGRLADCSALYMATSLMAAKRFCEEDDFNEVSRLQTTAVRLVPAAEAETLNRAFSVLLREFAAKTSRVDAASEALDLALRIRPEDLNIFIEQGYIHLLLARYQKALSTFERVREAGNRATPSQVAACLSGMASCHLERQELRAAEEKFREALAFEPGDFRSLEGIALVELVDKQRQAQGGFPPRHSIICKACGHQFAAQSAMLMLSLQTRVNSQKAAEPASQSDFGGRQYCDCPECGVGLQLDHVSSNGDSLVITSKRRVPEPPPWEWWRHKSEDE